MFSGKSGFAPAQATNLSLRTIPLFPNRFRANLRYHEGAVQLNSTSGAVASYVFSANGLYDPNITGTGHQPAGFDQMMLSYEHYTVIRSRLFVTARNISGNVNPTFAVSVRAGTTATTLYEQIVEDGACQISRLMGANIYGSMVQVRADADIAQWQGIANVLMHEELAGSVAANPAEQTYYHLQAWDANNDTASVRCDVTIEYEAWFTEPRSLTQSLSRGIKTLCKEVNCEGKR
jgi:hypothetical protein